MLADEQRELEEALRRWRDAEPPAALEGAVQRRVHLLLARARAAREADAAGAYPDWLMVLTAALLVLGLAGALILAAGQGLWPAVQQALGAAPLSRVVLGAVASNLLAALLAPALIMRRRSYGD